MRQSETPAHQARPRLAPVEIGHEHAFVSDQAESSRLPLADYWRVVKHYRWSIACVAAIAGVIGLLNALSATSLYQANTRLLVKFNQPNISNVQQFEPTPLHWLFFETQADIIKSRAVAERVVESLELDRTVPKKDSEAGAAAAAKRFSLRAVLDSWITEFKSWLPEELRPPMRAPLDERGWRTAVVNSVLGGVSVSGGKESEVLVVSYVSADPKMAADIANAFAQAYIDFGLESRVVNVQQATSWLGQRIEELRAKVVASEESLRAFQAREDLVDTENREKIISAKLGTLTAELIKAQSRRSEAEARYNQAKTFLDHESGYESIATVMNNTIVLEAHREKQELQRRVSELSERYGGKHPKMIAAKADLQEANRRLKAEVDKAINSVRKEYELAAAQEHQFQTMIAAQQVEMRTVSGKAFELKQLEREVAANRRLYETFLNRFKEADVADEYDVPNARIIDRAMIPTTPFKPNRKRMVFIAVILGISIGVALAFLREHLDNTFKTKDDVEERLRLPVIGMLPKIRYTPLNKGTVERQAFNNPRSPFAEAVNDIRTAVLFSQIDNSPKTVLITSAVPGEGKTTLASNLALAFSRRGRTLLIDADMRKGRIKEITGLKGHAGLTDMLSGNATIDDVLVPDPEAADLFVLPAGTLPPNPLEVVSSKRFSEELAKLQDSFDYIVVDGTPLLPVSDSIVLARLVDAIVFAIKADDTSHDVGLEALKRIQSARLRPVGVVMQQVDMRKMRSYGGRYVASYSGYYGYRKSKA